MTLDFGLEPALVVQFAGGRENGDPGVWSRSCTKQYEGGRVEWVLDE